MKSNLSKYICIGMLLVAASSCKKNNVVVDQDPLIPPEAARFTVSSLTASLIILEEGGGTTYKIPIGVTTVSDMDRTVHLTYESPSGAANGVQYDAPTDFTIPAGTAVDTLSIKGLFDGYAAGRKDTLKISITDADGTVLANAYNTTFTLYMQKYCEVVLDDLTGVYTNVVDYQNGSKIWGPYEVEIYDAVLTSDNTATVKIYNFWDYGTTITATLDWTDKANLKMSVAEQLLYVDSDYGDGNITSTSGSFSSCDQNFSLSFKVYYPAVAGGYSGLTTTIER